LPLTTESGEIPTVSELILAFLQHIRDKYAPTPSLSITNNAADLYDNLGP
jgi:hypothetical protein